MLSFMKPLLGVALLAAAAPLCAQAAPLPVPSGQYVLDRSHGSLTWQVRHLGLSNYTARFTGFEAVIDLDAANPTKSTVSVRIDPKSVRTDFPFPEKEDFDRKIATSFLRADKFPSIDFRSTGIVATGPDTGRLTGDLTFLGVTKPVSLDVKLIGAKEHPMMKKPAIGISARGSFKRSDFGMSDLQGILGDEIQLAIEAEFIRK